MCGYGRNRWLVLDSRGWQSFSIRHLTETGFVVSSPSPPHPHRASVGPPPPPPILPSNRERGRFPLSSVGFIECCSRKERNGTAWLLAKVRKIRGARRKMGALGCSLRSGKMDVKHILLRFSETRKSRMQFLNNM